METGVTIRVAPAKEEKKRKKKCIMEVFSGRHLQKKSILRHDLQKDIWNMSWGWLGKERKRDSLVFSFILGLERV